MNIFVSVRVARERRNYRRQTIEVSSNKQNLDDHDRRFVPSRSVENLGSVNGLWSAKDLIVNAPLEISALGDVYDAGSAACCPKCNSRIAIAKPSRIKLHRSWVARFIDVLEIYIVHNLLIVLRWLFYRLSTMLQI